MRTLLLVCLAVGLLAGESKEKFAPQFATPSENAKVAKLEKDISGGKVVSSLKALEKLATDKDAATAAAAKTTLETVQAWHFEQDVAVGLMVFDGDIYGAEQLAFALFGLWKTDEEAAKAYEARVVELRADPQYEAGKAFAKLTAVPEAKQAEPAFLKQVQAFIKKCPPGYYADQATLLAESLAKEPAKDATKEPAKTTP